MADAERLMRIQKVDDGVGEGLRPLSGNFMPGVTPHAESVQLHVAFYACRVRSLFRLPRVRVLLTLVPWRFASGDTACRAKSCLMPPPSSPPLRRAKEKLGAPSASAWAFNLAPNSLDEDTSVTRWQLLHAGQHVLCK
jgi:hypothetical protein